MKCDICKNIKGKGPLNLPGNFKYLLKIVRVDDRGVEMVGSELEEILLNTCKNCFHDKEAIKREFKKRLE